MATWLTSRTARPVLASTSWTPRSFDLSHHRSFGIWILSRLLSELLLRHPELGAEAEEIISTLLVVEDDEELADEIMAKLRALRASGPVSVDTGRGRVLDVLQPYIDDLTGRKERGARRAAAACRLALVEISQAERRDAA